MRFLHESDVCLMFLSTASLIFVVIIFVTFTINFYFIIQLETFKRALMQSLQEDDETTAVSFGALGMIVLKAQK